MSNFRYRGWEAGQHLSERQMGQREGILWAMKAMGISELTIFESSIAEGLRGMRSEFWKSHDPAASHIKLFPDVQVDGDVLVPDDHRLADLRDVTPGRLR